MSGGNNTVYVVTIMGSEGNFLLNRVYSTKEDVNEYIERMRNQQISLDPTAFEIKEKQMSYEINTHLVNDNCSTHLGQGKLYDPQWPVYLEWKSGEHPTQIAEELDACRAELANAMSDMDDIDGVVRKLMQKIQRLEKALDKSLKTTKSDCIAVMSI